MQFWGEVKTGKRKLSETSLDQEKIDWSVNVGTIALGAEHPVITNATPETVLDDLKFGKTGK